MAAQVQTTESGELEAREANLRTTRLSVWVCAVVLVSAALTGNGHTSAFHVLMAAVVGVPALIGLGRLGRAAAPRTLGTAGVQHSWITLSLGVAFLSLVPSTFFSAPGWIKALEALAALAWIGLGVYGLWLNARKLNVPISI